MYIAAEVQITAPSKDLVLSADEVKEVRKIVQDVLIQYCTALDGLLKASIQSFATVMYSQGLISGRTKHAANFNDIMAEFKSGLTFIHDGQRLTKQCQLFLQSLAKQGGGPYKRAAHSIGEEWTDTIKEKLNINIEFDIE